MQPGIPLTISVYHSAMLLWRLYSRNTESAGRWRAGDVSMSFSVSLWSSRLLLWLCCFYPCSIIALGICSRELACQDMFESSSCDPVCWLSPAIFSTYKIMNMSSNSSSESWVLSKILERIRLRTKFHGKLPIKAIASNCFYLSVNFWGRIIQIAVNLWCNSGFNSQSGFPLWKVMTAFYMYYLLGTAMPMPWLLLCACSIQWMSFICENMFQIFHVRKLRLRDVQ